MKVYLAGKIRGVENYQEIFAEGADKLRLREFEVFNPAAANLEGLPLGRIMSHVLWWLCEEAEAIALLPGWWKSGGARIEWMLARYLGLKVIYL